MLVAGAFHLLNAPLARGMTCMDVRGSWGAEEIKIVVQVVDL